MERFVERFRYKATKARQAQSRVKQIERIKRDAPSRDPRDERRLAFSFPPPERPGKVVLKIEGGRIEVPGRTLLDDVELLVERGEHVVLVGANGSGKTTLIETLAGRRDPAAGRVARGHRVELGYLSQHADTAAGDGTVLEAAQRETGLTGQKVRDLLGGFLFSGEDVEKKLADISGGEQRRLSLAILVASGANVLILDEPTNHLDIESREALEDALGQFEGAVVLVSHDRALLEAVGSRTLVCEDGALRNHLSGWADYMRAREEAEAAASPERRPGLGPTGGARRRSRGGPVEERAAPGPGARGADRERRGGAARGRGRARRPLRLVEPGALPPLDPTPRGREGRGGRPLRGARGGRGRPRARARLSRRTPAGHLAGSRRSMKLSASSAAENGISAWLTPGYSE